MISMSLAMSNDLLSVTLFFFNFKMKMVALASAVRVHATALKILFRPQALVRRLTPPENEITLVLQVDRQCVWCFIVCDIIKSHRSATQSYVKAASRPVGQQVDRLAKRNCLSFTDNRSCSIPQRSNLETAPTNSRFCTFKLHEKF